jgi:uncharacterized membrane protein
MRDEARYDVARWAQARHIDRARMPEALAVAGAVPSRDAWRHFLAQTLVWLGAVAIAAALAFFIAANWQALGRFGKLALVQVPIVVALAIVAWRGLDDVAGRAAILLASLAVGTLLALVGQTYQTGADTHELFVAWAIAILPWSLCARQPALLVLWVAIVDVAAWLYAGLSIGPLQLLFGTRGALWQVLAIHAVTLFAWEAAIARGVRWLDARYAIRLVAAGLGIAATMLVVEAIASNAPRDAAAVAAMLAYCAMLAALYVRYRRQRLDLFILAGAVLSVVVVSVAVLVDLDFIDDAGGFLATGLVIAALAAAGAHWLRRLAREAKP